MCLVCLLSGGKNCSNFGQIELLLPYHLNNFLLYFLYNTSSNKKLFSINFQLTFLLN